MADDTEIAAAAERLGSSGVRYVRFEMADLHGIARSKTVPIGAFQRYAKKGLNFYGGMLGLDTASNVVPGTGLNEEITYADCLIVPDLSTVQMVPWKPHTAKVICDFHFLDGRPIEASPRRVLSRLLDRAAAEQGFRVMMGHEFEFYLLTGDTHEKLFEGVHIANNTRNHWCDAVDDLLDQLQGGGVDVITHNSEYAPSQYEINFGPAVGLAGADKAFTFKNAVKEVAHRHGYLATFMSKPFPDSAGCGCHLHVSLLDPESGGNRFLDAADPDGLSREARAFAAGILAHAPAMMPLIGPTPNCYHRLKPHTFAPSRIGWGIEDRTALVRVKATRDQGTHIEMRGASGMSNPYLSAAATLAAGLLGLRDGLLLAPPRGGPCEDDALCPPLPRSLEAALDALAADGAMREMLGEPFVQLLAAVKRFELDRFRRHITDWERAEYLEIH